MLGEFREKYEAAMRPIGKSLGHRGVTPNELTTLSLLVAFLAGVAFALSAPILGGIGLLVSAIIDMLDGAVARAMRKSSRFGVVYDHSLDRYAEFFVLVGIGVGGLVNWLWVVFSLFGMVMASYVRAKAESVGGLKSCNVGVAERQEKLILLLIGSFLQPLLPIALTVFVFLVGLLSHVTVVQRLHYTHENARD